MAGKAGIRANRSKYSGQEVKKGLPEQLTCKRCRLDLSENKMRAAANGHTGEQSDAFELRGGNAFSRTGKSTTCFGFKFN